jgi:transposase InsO family protein
MIDRTANGRAFKLLNIIDEYTRECLAVVVKRRITSQDVIDKLFELFILRGIPLLSTSGRITGLNFG